MINKELIVLDSDLPKKEDIVHFLGEKAFKLGYITNLSEYTEAVEKREQEFSTAIGYGVSIPHGKCRAVQEEFIAFMRMKEPTVWGEKVDEPVRLVFLIGVPESKKGTTHLKILAQICKKLMDEDFRESLLKAGQEEAFKLLMEIEENIISKEEETK
jgi:PTS system, fructose subfamily, IIA component